ncbi:peptidoglycan D,D-transpeptidase FtsI family protein [Phocicoccus pinnipedialis]|uniref:peptidoglycan D,D-transpeptidase FtsI family protein n=1 Tax=Phocicoccus pinnipedialis TaxID=110845 RepID=UPI001F2BB6EF|nr:penicillin-binding protein 2 [Jeotgalicoccus pinnipedialis]
MLILRLGYLQIIKGDSYQERVENAQYVEINQNVPRGQIYDRNGKLLVGNKSERAIFFTRHRNMSNQEIFNLAHELAKYITVDDQRLALRDKQDYVLNHYFDQVLRELSDEAQLLKDGAISNSDFYNESYNQLSEEFVDMLLTDKDLNVLSIYVRMIVASELNPVAVKSKGVTEEEFARVNQDLDQLDGITTGMDWTRDYKFGNTLRTIFGDVSSSEEGLPKELTEYYKSLGYSNNDRVGKSYLEFQYEDILRGTKEEVKYSTDRSGKILGQEVVRPGKPGNDLYITIDIELQKEVEKLAEHHLKSLRKLAVEAKKRNDQDNDLEWDIHPEYIDAVNIVVQDPHNGEILAMVGKRINEDGKIEDFDYGTFAVTYVPGSSVKMGTVVTGYQNDVLVPGEFLTDEPMVFQDGTEKASFFNRDSKVDVDDQEAIMVSSNVYMMKIALKLLGLEYEKNMPLPIDISENSFKLRNGLNQFGLGVSTGIDLPNEETGIAPPLTNNPGNYLDLAIGQYDTYSAMQLAQYISTVVNGGSRLQSHLAKEVREYDANDSGPIVKTFNANVLNTVQINNKELEQLHNGMFDVFNKHDQTTDRYGTGWDAFHNLEPKAAGKTGTAEAYREGNSVLNQTYLGYAPADSPDMAFSIIWPTMPMTIPFFPAQYLGKDLVEKYYELEYGQPKKKPYNYSLDEFYPRIKEGTY